MKRKSLLFLLLFALIAPWAANAQSVTVQIGDGTATTNANPIGTWYNYSITEQLYTAEEIAENGGGIGTINSISFYYNGTAAKDFPITVYMKEVEAANLSTGISLADATQVFNGTLSVTTTAGWVTITLPTPYDYTGGNLLIGVNKGYVYYFSGQTWTGTTTSSTMASYTQQDGSAYTTSTTPGSANNTRPNIQMAMTLAAPPTCEKPTNLAVDFQGGTTATATWDGEASLYNIDINGTVYPGVTSPYPFAVEPNTTYTVKVQADCGDGDLSYWTSAVSITTPCAAYALPYAYGFEDPNDLNCWDVIAEISSTGITSATDAAEGSYVFRFHYNEQNAYLVSPIFSGTANGLDVSFQYMNSSTYTSYTEQFQVGYTTNAGESDPSNYTYGATIYGENSWVLYENSFPANTKRIAIKYIYTDGMYLRLDDFNFDTPQTCPKPKDLAASNITGHTVDLSWTETGSATAWQIMLNGDETNLIPANSNPFTVTGLAPVTSYTAKVRAYCSADDQSRWSNEVSFTTDVACPAPRVTVDNITPTTAEASWTGEASSYNLRYRPVDASTTATVILTAGDVWGDGSGYQMLLDADATAYGTIIPESGGLTSSGDASAATYAEFEYKIPVNADGSMTTTNVVLDNSIAIQIPAGTYDWCITNPTPDDRIWIASGNGSIPGRYDDYVFEAGNVYEFTVSFGGTNDQVDLTINGAKSAPRPVYAKQTNVRRGEVKNIANVMPSIHNYTKLPLEVPSRDEQEWIVVEDVTSPYTMDVEPGTNYEVQVMAICGGEDGSSEWSASTYFTTPTMCDAPNGLNATNIMTTTATLNWNGYQDGFEVRYRPVNSYEPIFEENFENGIPSTWTTIDADGDGNNWFALSDIGTLYPFYESLDLSSWAHGGSNSAVSASAYNNPSDQGGYTALTSQHWLITPQLELQGTLRFFVKSADSSYPDSYEVLLSTTGNATTDFTVALQGVTAASADWTEVAIDLSDYAGTQGYIAIFHGTEDMYFLLIDDFGLYNDVENDWETVTSDALSVDIEGLDPETEYEWQVRGEYRGCTNGEDVDFTPWSTVSTFTTHGLCDNPNTLTWESTATTATLSWIGYQDSYNVTYFTPAEGEIVLEEEYTFDGFADWTAIVTDEENEESDFYYLASDYSIMGYGFSSTDTPQYLISPEFDAPLEGNSFVEFMYYATGTEENENLPETFMIGYSTTDNEVSSFTWGEPVSVSGNNWYDADLPEGAKYFGIQYTSDHASDSTFLFVIAPYVVSNYVPAGEPTTLTGVTSPATVEGLEPTTIYRWEVTGICGEESTTQTVYSYFMTTYAQTITLAQGSNWFSTNLDITLVDLQRALRAALPSAANRSIRITSQNSGYCQNLGNNWNGQLRALDVAQMYMITVPSACEIMLSGWPIDPAEHPVNIVVGSNWIGFPLQEGMTLNNAFAGFGTTGDIVKSQTNGQATKRGNSWIGQLKNLVPGNGYIYNASATGTLTFPSIESKSAKTSSLYKRVSMPASISRTSITKMK